LIDVNKKRISSGGMKKASAFGCYHKKQITFADDYEKWEIEYLKINKGKNMKNLQWTMGFLGFLGFLGIPAITKGDWMQALWFLWFIWFAYFFQKKKSWD
jgi:Protein of unknown function (DUF3796)